MLHPTLPILLPKHIICLSPTLDWGTISWDDFCEKTIISNERDWVMPLLKYWNKHLGLSFLQYRAKIKAIATENIRQVENCDIISAVPCLIHAIEKRIWRERPDKIICNIVDDDDWHSPDLFSAIDSHYLPAVRFYIWLQHFNTSGGFRRSPRMCCDSHNYAIPGQKRRKKDFVFFQGQIPYDKFRLSLPSEQIVVVNHMLSIRNLTPASLSCLRRIHTPDKKPDIPGFKTMIRNGSLTDLDIIPDDCSWARSCIEQTNEVNRMAFGWI